MSAIEIVGGVVLLAVSVVIIVLTLMQHTHGQGLSGALCGGHSGLCVRQPSGLSTHAQPRVRRGCFSAYFF